MTGHVERVYRSPCGARNSSNCSRVHPATQFYSHMARRKTINNNGIQNFRELLDNVRFPRIRCLRFPTRLPVGTKRKSI